MKLIKLKKKKCRFKELKMKIKCVNTGEIIKFGDLIKRWQDKYPGIVNHRWLNYKLCNGESIFVEGKEGAIKEYKRKVKGDNN